MTGPAPYWDQGRHADRRPFLLARGRIKTAIRRWFEDQGFIEVEPGALQVSPGNETHLHAFKTSLKTPDGTQRQLYLHTSPEFACKKLLAAGETKLFTFARVYRNRERGPLHAPEFTMLEWYRADAPYRQMQNDCANLIKTAARTTGREIWTLKDRRCDTSNEPDRLDVTEAFARHAGIDLRALLDVGGSDPQAFAGAARSTGIRVAPDDGWSDIFSKIITTIEPHLGIGRPTILDRYPLREAALARRDPDDPILAERFELYACGIELANGFGELTDAEEQRRRFEHEMAEKERIYAEHYPIDEDFLAALSHMPPASGCALGFDRLAMLASGATRIDQVLWTPLE